VLTKIKKELGKAAKRLSLLPSITKLRNILIEAFVRDNASPENAIVPPIPMKSSDCFPNHSLHPFHAEWSRAYNSLLGDELLLKIDGREEENA